MSDEMREVRIPSSLCRLAEEKYRHRFSSVEQLLIYVLQQVVRDDAVKMDQDEQRIIEERLKDLGYI